MHERGGGIKILLWGLQNIPSPSKMPSGQNRGEGVGHIHYTISTWSFGGCFPVPKTGMRVHSDVLLYQRLGRGHIWMFPCTKKGSRVHSPKAPFYGTTLFGRLIFVHLHCWEVLPFLTFQRQRCIKILCPKGPEFYTPLALNCQKGQHFSAPEVYKKMSPTFVSYRETGTMRHFDVFPGEPPAHFAHFEVFLAL